MIKLYDTFHTDIDSLQFRIVFSPPNGSDEWLVVLPYYPTSPIMGAGIKIRSVQAIIDTIRITGDQVNIVLIDKYEELYQRRAISPEVITGTSDLGLGLINSVGEYNEPSLRRVIYELRKFYTTNPFFQDVVTSTFTSIDTSKTEPYPIFSPNTIVTVEMLYDGKWYPIFTGFIRRIDTSLTKLGKAYRTVSITAVHPFSYLFKQDFVHSLFTGMFTPELFRNLDLSNEERDLYIAMWIGQYDDYLVDTLTKTIRGVSLMQYFSLPQLFRLIHRVGNLRIFSKYMESHNHSKIYDILRVQKVVEKDIKYYEETYNTLLKRYSPLRYFADNNIDVFGELEDYEYIAPEDDSLSDWFITHVGVDENVFDFRNRLLPFKMIVDRRVASCGKSFTECTDFVKRLYKGVFSLSFSFFIEKSNRRTVGSVVSELSSALQLDAFNVPNGWNVLTFPAMFKSLDNGIVTTLKEASAINHVWDADSLATVTTGYAGQDYLDINSDVLKKTVYWGIYIDVPNTVRYGMKEITAPTIYYPTWGTTREYKALWRKYLQSYQMVANAENFSSTLSYNNLILHPIVMYSIGQPVFVGGLDWIYTLRGFNFTFTFSSASLTQDLILQYGVPMGLYNYIHINHIAPTWKVVRDTIDELAKLNLDTSKEPQKQFANTPTSESPTKKKPYEKHTPPNVNTITPADVESITEMTKSKPGTSKNYVDTVVDAMSYRTTNPSKSISEVIPNRYILRAVENVFQSNVLPILQTEWSFTDYEIVVDYEAYYPKGYRNITLNTIGMSIKGIKLFNPHRGAVSRWGKLISKLNQTLREELLRVEGEYLWIPIHSLKCGAEDPYGIDWSSVANEIRDEIYGLLSYANMEVSVYSDVCGNLTQTGDIKWVAPWIKVDSGVWVFHCSSRFNSMVQIKSKPSNKYIAIKYGNKVSVVPADSLHCSDIYIMTSWNLTEVV